MTPIPKRWKKESPVILTAPASVPLAVAPTPIPLVVAPAPIVLLPAVPVPVAVVVGMAPPPAPIPLIPVVVGRAPPQARVPTQAEAMEPIHPLGILVKIVGTEMSCQGCSCKEHKMYGKVLKEDVVLRLRKMQLMVEWKEETAIAVIWVIDGIHCCRVGFVPCHMVRHAAQYNGALTQITHVFSGDPETCNLAERCLFFFNKVFCITSIISILLGQV